VVVLALASLVLYWSYRPPTSEAGPVYLSLVTPLGDLLHVEGTASLVAISPDGKKVAYPGRRGGKSGLFLRTLDNPEVRLLVDATDPKNPFFSPDGQWIGFTSGSSLKKVNVDGRSPIEVCSATWGGGSWGRDGNIVFTNSYSGGLRIISSDGHNERNLTDPDLSAGELGHWWPQILPDGKNVLFTRFKTPIDNARAAVLNLETGRISEILDGGTFARRIMADVPMNFQDGQPYVAFSESGTLVYAPTLVAQIPKSLVWVDQDGREEFLDFPRRPYYSPALSADGTRAIVPIPDEAPGGVAIDLWSLDLRRGSSTRLTFGPAGNFGVMWGHGGDSLFFMREDPYFEIYRLDLAGNLEPQAVLRSPIDKYPNDVSPDGKSLILSQWQGDSGNDLWILPLDGQSDPTPFRQTPFHEQFARISPRGDWVAYTSNESGQFEIYTEAFPGGGSRFQVSVDGGTAVEWSPGGQKLFYKSGNRMMAVEVRPGPPFSADKPVQLFEGEYSRSFAASGLQVGPDGRFLMLKTQEALQPRELKVVLNWFAELERKVP